VWSLRWGGVGALGSGVGAGGGDPRERTGRRGSYGPGVQEILETIEVARRELERSPADGLASARARGALSRAREAWGTLDAGERARVSGPAGELRGLLDAVAQRRDPPPTPEALLERFGLSSFRAGQREAVAAALAGRDTLVVMPTGAGKSLCYQLPALASEGDPARPLVVVVSPLIALMRDQWQRLRETGVRAVMLASGMEEGHNGRALLDIESGWAQLVLAAPERFGSRAFREVLGTRKVGLFVVDEAHCVAEWGHDFRPDYLRLQGAIATLGRPPVMAATATATPRVAGEIAARLGLREWVSVSSGFDRPNLAFDVVSVEGKGAVARKRAALLHVLEDARARPAIVYCGTRRDTEEVAALISGRGIATVAYHAGLPPRERRGAQEAFMGGEAEVVVATNAFGMGVDKADVRTVAHWAVPTSLEGYYQEAGRGGRDGEPARALLLASRMDLGRLIRFNTERQSSVEAVRGYVARLARRAREGLVEIAPGELDDSERVLLSIAERAGAAELQPGSRGVLRVRLTGHLDGGAAYGAIKAARDRGWESYRAIERFIANGSECRRRQILEHFGDTQRGALTGRCCSVCDPDTELERAVAAGASATKGTRGAGRGTGARGRKGSTPNASTIRDSGSQDFSVPNGSGSHDLSSNGSGSNGSGSNGSGSNRSGSDGSGSKRSGSNGSGSNGSANSAEPVDEERYEKLREWRLAQAEGKPAFTVAANTVLEEILRTRPETLEELIEIRGIGPAFCEKHGESLLEVLGGL
jgi:ATP-dependent DNA helicase RecQ